MKTFRLAVLAIATLISSINVTADDDIMRIKLSNGSTVDYKVSDIDLITFESNGVSVSEKEAINLGLSVKWASVNIGASKPSDYGDYFAWGETETKTSFLESNSKWYGLSYSSLESQGVIDAKGNLTAKYDAATANWGGNWRMPTYDEINELINKCKWTRTTQDGHNGYQVTGPNGNSIFLPAAGRNFNGTLYDFDTNGDYWSSTANDIYDFGYCIYFGPSGVSYRGSSYPSGQSVRPVTK